MSRYDDIQAHRDAAKTSLALIEEEYQSSLKARQINPQLKIQIKNYLENLRSCLDYIAGEINEKYCTRRIRCYFPMACKDKIDFCKFMRGYFPGLEARRKDLFDKLESYQAYNANGRQFLPPFATLVNENKHDQLSPQTRTEKRGLKIDFAGGGGITLGPGASIKGTGKIISGEGILELKGKTISGDSPAEGLPQTIKQTVIIWVGFRFDAIGKEALPFLKEVLSGVESIVDDLSKELWP